MTCVLPYRNCNQRRFRSHTVTMPCVFDGCEPLDFESALLSGDWPTPTKDNSHNTATYGEDDIDRATSGSAEKSPMKRKYTDDGENGHHSDNETTEPKKPCVDNSAIHSSSSPPSSSFANNNISYDVVREIPSQTCPVTTSSDDEECVHPHSNRHHEVASQTSMEEEEEEEEDLYLPRRRVPQMWNSRQRWKDERKKVLKLSVNKLTEIEDPELWLLRSVLINNTIKRLHQDIRTERQAKIRHRQQKIDFYSDRYEPQAAIHRMNMNYQDVGGSVVPPYQGYVREDTPPKPSPCPTSSDIYDENSCDEIFGISEDFLRVTIPDRRVSSPLPTSPVQGADPLNNDNEHQNDPSTQMDVDQSSSESTSSTSSTSSSSSSSEDCIAPPSIASSINNAVNNTMMASAFSRTMASHQAGSQCATQFRTNTTSGIGEVGIFPPRVPILDSVVYHSLLASLESS